MIRRLWIADWLLLGYCAVVAALCVIRPVPHGWAFALAHLAVAGGVLLLVRLDRPGVPGFLRCWDALAWIPLVFFLNMHLVPLVHPRDYDSLLIRVDEAIGGIALLRGMGAVERPWMTDVGKLLWVSYYVFPLAVGIPLYRRGRAEFARLKGAMLAGWLVSYLCYFALPARGPGWLLHEMNVAAPRWEETSLAPRARAAIHAMKGEARVTFPSGHVIIAVVGAAFLAWRRCGAWAWVGVPWAAGIATSTLYLRYHYLVDDVAGVAIAAGCVALGCAQRKPQEDVQSPQSPQSPGVH